MFENFVLGKTLKKNESANYFNNSYGIKISSQNFAVMPITAGLYLLFGTMRFVLVYYILAC
jgi:hypothetical protein